MTALLKEIKHFIVIINHFFFTRTGFILKVLSRSQCAFPATSDFFFSNFQVVKKKLNLVLNCNIYRLEKNI